MPEPARLSILTNAGQLASLRPAWTGLWQRDPAATPFQSPDWLIPWWRHFGEGELRVLTLCRAGELIGVFPCYIYNSPGPGPRKLLPVGVSTSDYIDGSFDPQCSAEEIAAGLELLLADPDWDELWFPQLRHNSRLCAALRQLRSSGCYEHEGERTSRVKPVPPSQLPPKLRKNVANYRNRAQRGGRLELVRADPSNWGAAFDTLCSLHSRRWREAGESGVLADPRVLAWHREAIPALLETGTARLSSLCLDGQSLAVLYSLVDPPSRAARTQYCYLIGFSPDYAELSPGTLLLAAILDEAAKESISTVDFLRGDEPYKDLWHPEHLSTVAASSHQQRHSTA